jgi:hypothetical protein
MTRDEARYYLAALIDGEGSVRHPPRREVTIGNTNPEIIERLYECCYTLGLFPTVTHTQRVPPRKDIIYVSIGGAHNFRLLQELALPLADSTKRRKIVESPVGDGRRPCPHNCPCRRHTHSGRRAAA